MRFFSRLFLNGQVFAIFFVLFFSFIKCDPIRPRLTVVFVVDQCGKFYIDRLKPKFRAGLGFLVNRGINYENAFFPHANPATSTGHAALNTGVYAKDHGIVANNWLDELGNKIYFPDVTGDKNSLVFDNNGGTFEFSRSPKRLMAQGISNSFALFPKSGQKNYVYALSIKDRAAIATAGQLGKAVWFEGKNGCFTSSKAYFEKLPDWVKKFNDDKKLYNLKKVKWEPAYGLNTSFYKFNDTFNYDYSQGSKLIGTDVDVYKANKPYPHKYLFLTPYSNDILFDLAETCIENTVAKDKTSNLLLWVSLSSLDKLGHLFGPMSAEVIDTMYQIDIRIEKFMKNVQKLVDKAEVLYVLTADHGVSIIPEMAKNNGILNAERINSKELLGQLNDHVNKNFEIKNIFTGIEGNQVYVDKKIFAPIDWEKKNKIRESIKKLLKSKSWVKDVWTYDELKNKCCKSGTIESNFKNQLYQDRSGEFIICTNPYCLIAGHKAGAAHCSPYNFDTHVPLIFYQKGSFELKNIYDKVSMLQFANTLADILKVPKASQSTFASLPWLFDEIII